MLTKRPVIRGRRVLLGLGGLLAVLLVAVFAFSAGRGAGGGDATESSPSGSAARAPGVVPAVPAPDAARSGGAASSPESGTGGVAVGDVTRQLVRTAQLDLGVDDPAAATGRVRTIVAGAGGTVAEESATDGGGRLTLRVPAAKLDAVIDDIAGLGKVTTRSSQTVDATEDVVDLDARVASQRAGVDRVRALLSQAKTIGDVVSIESELTRREADLDSLTNRLTALRGQVALSTLTVDLAKGVVTPPPPGPTGFLAGLANGWDGLKALGTATGTAVGFVLPFLPLVAVLVGLVWAGRRLVRSRRGGSPGPQPAAGP